MKSLRLRLREERGEGIVSALLLLAGVLLPLLFLVVLFGRVEQGRLTADQTAQDAVRAASLAPSQSAAEQAVQTAAAQAQQQTGLPLTAVLEGDLVRGGTLTAVTTIQVSVGGVPFLGSFGTITIHGQAQAPVDQYRSLATGAEGP